MLGLVVVSCVEELTIDSRTQEAGDTLVIDGQISADGVEVRLSRISNFRQPVEPQDSALVQVWSSDQRNIFLVEVLPDSPGTYQLPDGAGFSVIPGQSYWLDVTLVDGSRYATRPDTVPQRVGRDRVSWQQIGDAGQRYIGINAKTSYEGREGPAYTLWETLDTYRQTPTDFPDPFGNVPFNCFVTRWADIQRVSLLAVEDLRTDSVEVPLAGRVLIDSRFDEKHVITLYHRSISRDAFEYWTKVQLLLNQQGNLTDAPPAAAPGNAFSLTDSTEEVLGYTMAVQNTLARFPVYPFNLTVDIGPECEFVPFKSDYPTRCLNCLSEPNSSYEVPLYYDEVR